MDDRGYDGSLDATIAILETLIAFPSVSARSNVEITDWCAETLSRLGFACSRTFYDDERGVGKANLVAVRQPLNGQAADAGLAYFCHTDVVPAKKWVGAADGKADPVSGDSGPSPFRAVVTNDRVYGRGACDMKGSLAAMMSAVARIDPQLQKSPIWIVCTADEEVGFGGAKYMVEHCSGYQALVRSDPVAIIGEPTEMNVVYAHKGIHGFTIHSQGRAGHSATRYGINANEAMVPMLVKLLELCQRTREDTALQDDRFDPPVLSWNFGVSDHSNVFNITPERSDAWVSFRTMPEIDARELVAEAETMARQLGLTLCPFDGCDPLWTDPQSDFVLQLQSIAGTRAQTVCYATDGGVLGGLSQRVVIGPGSIHQAHTVDEWIAIDQLRRGIECYENALRRWCC